MLINFDSLPDDSRIWIYSSEDKLTVDQENYILNNLNHLLKTWEAHKVPLYSGIKIINNHFIVVALDESKNCASGCSIDMLQKKVQKIEKELDISLLNRLNVFCVLDNTIVSIEASELKDKVNQSTFFYDLTISKKSDLNNFLKPIQEGWCLRLIH